MDVQESEVVLNKEVVEPMCVAIQNPHLTSMPKSTWAYSPSIIVTVCTKCIDHNY